MVAGEGCPSMPGPSVGEPGTREFSVHCCPSSLLSKCAVVSLVGVIIINYVVSMGGEGDAGTAMTREGQSWTSTPDAARAPGRSQGARAPCASQGRTDPHAPRSQASLVAKHESHFP